MKSQRERIKIRQKQWHRISADRSRRIRRLTELELIEDASEIPEDAVPIDPDRSAFMKMLFPVLFYRDIDFNCRDCAVAERWYATDQQDYFENKQDNPEKRPVRCFPCRQIEVERKRQARITAGHATD